MRKPHSVGQVRTEIRTIGRLGTHRGAKPGLLGRDDPGLELPRHTLNPVVRLPTEMAMISSVTTIGEPSARHRSPCHRRVTIRASRPIERHRDAKWRGKTLPRYQPPAPGRALVETSAPARADRRPGCITRSALVRFRSWRRPLVTRSETGASVVRRGTLWETSRFCRHHSWTTSGSRDERRTPPHQG